MGQIGRIGWIDLTVDNTDAVRDFYQAVVGWDIEPVDMGGYADYNLCPPGSGEGIAGLCHARGSNTGLPNQWLLYITIADLDASIIQVQRLGGQVLRDIAPLAGGRFAVVVDPSGAVSALYQEAG